MGTTGISSLIITTFLYQYINGIVKVDRILGVFFVGIHESAHAGFGTNIAAFVHDNRQ